jgi:hypothetical protein
MSLSCCPLAQDELRRPASFQSQVILATMAWVVENTFMTFKEVEEDEYEGAIRSCPAQVESGMLTLEETPPEDMVTCAGTKVLLTGKAVANPGVAQSLDEGRTREHDLPLLKCLRATGNILEGIVNRRRRSAFGDDMITDDGAQASLVGVAAGGPPGAYESNEENDGDHSRMLWSVLSEKCGSLAEVVCNRRGQDSPEHDHTDSREDDNEVDTPRVKYCSQCATLVRKVVTRFPSAQKIVEVLRVSMSFWAWTSERLFAHVSIFGVGLQHGCASCPICLISMCLPCTYI